MIMLKLMLQNMTSYECVMFFWLCVCDLLLIFLLLLITFYFQFGAELKKVMDLIFNVIIELNLLCSVYVMIDIVL